MYIIIVIIIIKAQLLFAFSRVFQGAFWARSTILPSLDYS